MAAECRTGSVSAILVTNDLIMGVVVTFKWAKPPWKAVDMPEARQGA